VSQILRVEKLIILEFEFNKILDRVLWQLKLFAQLPLIKLKKT